MAARLSTPRLPNRLGQVTIPLDLEQGHRYRVTWRVPVPCAAVGQGDVVDLILKAAPCSPACLAADTTVQTIDDAGGCRVIGRFRATRSASFAAPNLPGLPLVDVVDETTGREIFPGFAQQPGPPQQTPPVVPPVIPTPPIVPPQPTPPTKIPPAVGPTPTQPTEVRQTSPALIIGGLSIALLVIGALLK